MSDIKYKKFGWAFIGAGSIACKVAAEIVREGSCRIVSVWNRTPSRAQSFASQFGAAACRTPEAALAAPGVEGAYVCVEPAFHADYVRRCLAAGAPVLCEKPFTLNAAEAASLFRLAREKGLYLSEAMWTWHNAAAQKVRSWVRGGAVGRVRSLRAVYAYPLTLMPCRRRLLSAEGGGGALLDIGVYPVRYVYELFGMPDSVACTGRLRGGVDLGEKIAMRYPSFTAEIAVSMTSFGGEKLVIRGAEGKIVVPEFHAARRAVLIRGGKREVFRDGALLYARQFAQAADEIRTGCREGARIPAQGTLDVLRLTDECRRQMGQRYPRES